jgi:hypothetical protein
MAAKDGVEAPMTSLFIFQGITPVASVYSARCDMNGGSDGARTRGLCRDSVTVFGFTTT